MRDIEEPPAKITKHKVSSQNDKSEAMEEDQEEWLSEGLLTDDDNHQADPNKTDSNLDTSQEDLDETFLDESVLSADHSMDSADHSMDSQNLSQGNDTQDQDTSQENIESQEPKAESIEQKLNNLEDQKQETTDKQIDKASEKSDGNDTDDLLRLLEDNEEKSKKKMLVKTKSKNDKSRTSKKNETPTENDEDTEFSDDEFIFNSSSVKNVLVTKNAIRKKTPTKAEPEDMSDATGDSSDEASTMKNIFAVKQKVAAKSTTKLPYRLTPSKTLNTTSAASIAKKAPTKHASLPTPQTKPGNKASTPLRVSTRIASKDIQKKPSPAEYDEIINKHDFSEEDDDFDLNDDFADSEEEVTSHRNRQQIMRPEQMDEEVPTDSQSESDISMYDDLPSSDSEDIDDWFTLDIRAERASDYLPLLGDKAYDLLSGEKRRVTERLKNLRQRVSQVHQSGLKQAAQLRRAAVAIAELDDMLKAT